MFGVGLLWQRKGQSCLKGSDLSARCTGPELSRGLANESRQKSSSFLSYSRLMLVLMFYLLVLPVEIVKINVEVQILLYSRKLETCFSLPFSLILT